jgi:putative oxidoreductase
LSRHKSIAVWVLQFLLAALFTIQGIVKLNASPAWIARFRGWGYPDHFYLVVGLAELLAKFSALLLVVVMVGATATHVLHREPQVITTLVLLALLAFVLYLRRGRAATA